jgi:hypothetical protein
VHVSADSQQVGPDGKRKVLANGKRQVGGSTCCCGGPTDCNGCASCTNCDYLAVVVSLPREGGTYQTVTHYMPRDLTTPKNCEWALDSSNNGVYCSVPVGSFTDPEYGVTVAGTGYWTLLICDVFPNCCAHWRKPMTSGCPTADGWQLSNQYDGSKGPSFCNFPSIISISCGTGAPPP